MNRLKAKVSKITNEEILHLVEFEYNKDTIISMVSLELDSTITVGSDVVLATKPTQTAVAINDTSNLSYSNRLKAKVVAIKEGKIVSSIQALLQDGTILESIITTTSLKRLSITQNDDITILIKATELSISEVCND